MSNERYRLAFHIAPQHGWLNDPNGLCQFKGAYHAFFQYNPEWPERDTKHWRHFVSKDLLHWHDEGTALVTDIPEDRSGVYSGSAFIEHRAEADGGDLMCLYYTGNVIYPGGESEGYDYVHSGREANEILVTSEDGIVYSTKQVLLRNADYPDVCTRHVRDPKVWEQDGMRYMLLGARDQDDEGFCLLYESSDGIEWSIASQIYSKNPFGFMWECPNIVQIEGHDFLAVCPQGLPSNELYWQNKWNAGYFPLEESIVTTSLVDEASFIEWDHGYDFYAPQVFADDSGRQILIGWMGAFGETWTSTPNGLSWCHCLTVPRELTRAANGLLLQTPIAELETIRTNHHELEPGKPLQLEAHRADIMLEGVRSFKNLVLDGALQISFSEGILTVCFIDEAVSGGRPQRSIALDTIENLRILVDTSAVELYANEGACVFSTRWFPTARALQISSDFDAQTAVVYDLEDALRDVYA